MVDIKAKICKRGTGKAIGFEGCKQEIPSVIYNRPNFKYGLGISCRCYSKWLLTTEEGKEQINRSRLSARKKTVKEVKQEAKRKKIESKSIDKLKQEARSPFQKLIRIRDHGMDCICCGRPLPFNIGDYDAGHFLKAEIYSGLIFHPDNAHGQLVYCNKHSHGNEIGYSEGIIKRIGIERYEKLMTSKETLKNYKYDRYFLIELKEYYSKELKLVEKGFKNINEVDLSIGIFID